MKILHLISSSGQYGAENMLLALMRELRRLGCESALAAFRNSRHPHTEIAGRAREEGSPAEIVRCHGRLDRECVREIAAQIERQRADIVHCHGYKADIYGYLAARRLSRPILATCHNWTGDTAALKLYGCLDRLVLRKFDRVVAVSETVASVLRRWRIPRSRLQVIENGIDPSPWLSAAAAPAAPPAIGMVGRLVRQKGFDRVLLAARGILRDFPDARFLIVGEGPDRARLENLARKARIESSVVFTGRCDDMERVYASLDVLVLPSLNEGTPISLLEAMAAGKAVVASRAGAIPRIVEHGRTGFLIDPGNPDELAHSILALLWNPHLRSRIGSQARAVVMERFSAAAMARRYTGVYHELVARSAEGQTETTRA